MSTEEQNQLLEQSQDVALTGTVLSGLYRELSNEQWDALVESIGKEVYELVRRRVNQAREELEAQAVSGEGR